MRGGVGNAGARKHRKLYFQKYFPEHFLKNRGFVRPDDVTHVKATIDVCDLDEKITLYAGAGNDGTFTVDLAEHGVDKLLGSGQVRHKIMVTVGEATPSAMKKIQAAGGQVTTTVVKAPPKEKAKPSPPPGGKPPKGDSTKEKPAKGEKKAKPDEAPKAEGKEKGGDSKHKTGETAKPESGPHAKGKHEGGGWKPKGEKPGKAGDAKSKKEKSK
jgi:large subunit ribosomal protein L15